MPAQTTASPAITVKAGGTPLPAAVAAQLLELLVDQRGDAPDLFRLTFHDPELKLLEEPSLAAGKEISVEIEVDPNLKGVLTVGEVTSVALDDDAWGTQVVVQGMDRSHVLFRTRTARTFLNATFSDVVKKLAEEAGLGAQVQSSPTVHEYLSQSGQTDWEFLHGLADQIGWDLWLENRTLHFAEPATATSGSGPVPKLTRGVNLFHLTAVLTAGGQPQQVESRGWNPQEKQAVVGRATTSPTVGVDAGIGSPASFRGLFDTGTMDLTRAPHRTQAEADAAASAAAEDVASAFVELQAAAFGDPRIKARGVVEIANAGDRISGRYVVTQVRHVWEPEAGYRTELNITGRQDRSLLGLAGGGTAHAAAAPQIHGVVVGVVTNNKDPENLGRVKVKFPWWSDSEESDWARVAQVLTGNGYGALIMPEVNDEVLVAFEHGHMDRPYVVGSLYNGKDHPAKTSDEIIGSGGKVGSQRLESRSHHRLVFFDQEGSKEGVTLRTGDDKYYINLNKTDTTIVVSSDGDVRVEAKNGTVTVEAQEMQLKSTGKLEATAQGSATLKSAGKFTVEGTGGLELKSSGVVEVKGSLIKLN
ncbi:MAG: VgrG-related protein [Nitriliruptorales bacterium]|nr:VgrG-related protein [Nitriliruptorales bacterium]